MDDEWMEWKWNGTNERRKLKGAERIYLITADSKRAPCLIKFSIPVGVGQVSLLKATEFKLIQKWEKYL